MFVPNKNMVLNHCNILQHKYGLKVSRGGYAFLGRVLLGVKANCCFKLTFKDAEILQIDPLMGCLLLKLNRINLSLKSVRFVFEFEPFTDITWDLIWWRYVWVSHSLCSFLLSPARRFPSLSELHCGLLCPRDSFAHHVLHCIHCGGSWLFCSIALCYLVAVWPVLLLKTWTTIKVKNCSSKRCRDIQSGWWVVHSHCLLNKTLLTDTDWGLTVVALSLLLGLTKHLVNSKKCHFRNTLLDVHRFDVKLC